MIISKDAFTHQLGENIRKYRIKKGLTVEELALNTNLAYSQISRIELGKIKTSAYTIYLIAIALDVCPKMLFAYEIK